MNKAKTSYSCQECGAISLQWNGQCNDCEAWNSLVEVVLTAPSKGSRSRQTGYAGEEANIIDLGKIPMTHELRLPTGLSELDRVLGGGIVQGSVILIGGDPGVGKSTLLLQTLAYLSANDQCQALYVTGEESLQQVKLRAHRLDCPDIAIRLLAETQVERIISLALQEKPQVMVVDSIQTINTEVLQSAPGSVSQVRESAAQLVRFAKQVGIAVFLVGHVTKEGTLAGPRVLEHMVDTVLYFEGESDSRFRVIRAVKIDLGRLTNWVFLQ